MMAFSSSSSQTQRRRLRLYTIPTFLCSNAIVPHNYKNNAILSNSLSCITSRPTSTTSSFVYRYFHSSSSLTPKIVGHVTKTLSASLSTSDVTNSISTTSISSSINFITESGGTVLKSLEIDDINSVVNVSSSISKPILETTELLTLPESLLLTPRTACNLLSTVYPSYKPKFEEFPEECLLSLALLHEKHQNFESSSFRTLISELPTLETLHCASLWTSKQLAWIQGSSIHAEAKDIQNGVTEEYEMILDQIPEMQWLKEIGRDEYAWACAIVDSQTIRVSSSEPLVLASLLHYFSDVHEFSEEGETQIENADISISGVGMFFSKKKLTIKAKRKLKANEQIVLDSPSSISSNSQLLLERGKVLNDSQQQQQHQRADAVDLQFNIAPFDRFREEKLDILTSISLPNVENNNSNNNNVEGNASFTLRAPGKRGLWTAPEDMDAFLRLTCLSGTDAFLLEPVFRNEVWGFMQFPVSAENEEAMCQLIIGACEDALDAYIGEKEKGEGIRWEMAKCLVKGEQEVLEATKKHYEKVLQTLDVLEYYAERRLKALDLLRPLDECEIVDSESGAQMGRAFDENYS